MPALTSAAAKLPPAICFRITRRCNARCRFCLAPPDGADPAEEILKYRLDWLVDRGVRRIHFCGGEPTIHAALPKLLGYVNGRGVKTSLCTNAIDLPAALLPLLRETSTTVRVSLHGDRRHHDAIAGEGCFDRTSVNLRRLLRAGVSTSMQSTVVAGGGWVVDWLADYCKELRVRRLAIVPFIPRGAGASCRDSFSLSQRERRVLHGLVLSKRRALAGILDVRWLDFTSGSLPVMETDGRLLLEGATETMDWLLAQL